MHGRRSDAVKHQTLILSCAAACMQALLPRHNRAAMSGSTQHKTVWRGTHNGSHRGPADSEQRDPGRGAQATEIFTQACFVAFVRVEGAVGGPLRRSCAPAGCHSDLLVELEKRKWPETHKVKEKFHKIDLKNDEKEGLGDSGSEEMWRSV